MSIFESLGNAQKPQAVNPQQAMQMLKSNPAQELKRAGYSIPAGMNNPTQILQHLLQSGQLTNPRLNALGQMAMNLFKRWTHKYSKQKEKHLNGKDETVEVNFLLFSETNEKQKTRRFLLYRSQYKCQVSTRKMRIAVR